ncbi:hypothetical protein BC939DRAFT_14079 [Gamsiella multidivaricata]|uniref:uncharacterized protein n=1 Tax=Gamsiella multidivaricata TaxID=101098 RepID=UPI00221F97FD|nr:uncharacterized protein BC939DRAFT_14079 [Gamsiella multidivaricata]KAI7829639.1 hypothetical protein BC939DRAFT_14079 [Gamsiella multidivaricata]
MSSLPLRPPQPELRPILFTVRDTGKGISPEFAQLHLFQRFSQEDPLQVGTGLGLALVKLLVESLGGWLEIYSEGIEGKGCVVRVLVWATPATNETKSLKDEQGAWQEKSCRFYTGESALSTDRLWKIMGERMIAQDLNMNVERGNEQDISPEDMLRDLNDQSPCDLLIFNDDLARLKAYLSYWTDEHQKAMGQDIDSSKVPTPLLMLISIWKHKKAQALIDAYVESWRERGGSDRAATVVLMPKPFGPLKLLGCLRSCFATNDDARSLHDHPELTDKTEDGAMMTQPSMMPLMRSATVPHITTMAMGVQDNRMLSAGIMIKSSFKFPASPAPLTELGSAPVPPHSPGGLVIGPKDPPTVLSDSDSQSSLSDGSVTAPRTDRDPSVIKPKTQRSIRKFMSHRSGSARAMGKKSSLNEVETINSGKSTVVLGEPLVSEGSDQLGMLKPVPRVLIVEDNMTNRMILRTFLKKRGVSVVEAENGKLGVERFQEEVWRRQGRSGFEFVLMDLQMPIMDGHLATKRIREFEHSMAKQHGLSTPEVSDISEMDKLSEAQDIPEFEKRGYRPTTIFALTGLAGEEDKRLAFESGVDGYLTKPVSLKTLGALLSSCHPSYEECLN